MFECLTLKTLFTAKNADDQLGLVEYHIELFPREFLARSPIQHMYFMPSGAQFVTLQPRVRQLCHRDDRGPSGELLQSAEGGLA